VKIPNQSGILDQIYYWDNGSYSANFVNGVFEYNSSHQKVLIRIQVAGNATFNNVILKPMLTTDLSATYNDYVQYSGDGELNENVAEMYKVSERVSDETYTNLINPNAQTTTKNGITFTNNGDGTYTVNGTATANVWFEPIKDMEHFYPANVILTGCPSGGSNSTYYLGLADAGGAIPYRDHGNGCDIPVAFNKCVTIGIVSGFTCNNLLFKPMITTKLDATYDDFIPYSGSGALNENVAEMYKEIQTLKNAITELGGTV
jgi:hypothetical protein